MEADRVRVILRVKPEVRERLRAVAADRLLSMNRVAEFALDEGLTKLERDRRGDAL